MAQPPLISIIIPCYNAERFVAETIRSVLGQTWPRREVIVVDDGSKDGSAEVIRSFGAEIKPLFGPNQGASHARNRGTVAAQGEFIQYLDADDLLEPDALEKRWQALQAHSADVAYADWQRLEEGEAGGFGPGEIVSRTIEDIHVDPEIALFTQFWSPPAALLYRRTLVDRIGGWNTALPIIQDARFAQDAALQGGKFIHVPGVGAWYRVHRGASLSRRDPGGFVRDVFTNSCQIETWWEEHGGISEERRKALVATYDYTARTLFRTDYSLFQENLRRLRRIDPGFRLTWPRVAGGLAAVFGPRRTLTILDGIKAMHNKVAP
ncbi:MAG: glycosyltransferase [Blastocatellia bacterium]|nr:glycosyltransferase [Blastocatellia bacterium]